MSVSDGATIGRRLLAEHVADFNHGVRTGDFGPMISRLADDALMSFEGVPAGPFRGRDDIREAYASQPPDDTLTILAVRESNGEVVADYAWDRRPSMPAGKLRLVHDGTLIRSLVVTFAGEQQKET